MPSAPCPTEHQEAVALVQWWRLACRRWGLPPEALLHVTNEGLRSTRMAAILKAEGMRPGAPDYLLLTPRCGYGCLGIELKRKHGSVVRESQHGMQSTLRRAGNRMEICYGAKEAINTITAYLDACPECPDESIGGPMACQQCTNKEASE